jgi:hypothetical protein
MDRSATNGDPYVFVRFNIRLGLIGNGGSRIVL